MENDYIDKEGRMIVWANETLAFIGHYLKEHPEMINRVAVTIVTGIPERMLDSLTEEAERKLTEEGVSLDRLVNSNPAPFKKVGEAFDHACFVQHPVLDRSYPVTELILGYGCMELDDLSRHSRYYGLSKGWLDRLRLNSDQLGQELLRLRNRGIDLDDKALFHRCAAEDRTRYLDIYNDLRIPTYVDNLAGTLRFEDIEVLFLDQLMKNPNIQEEDKQYILGSLGFTYAWEVTDLVRLAEERPLLRGLSDEERVRLMSSQTSDLERFVQRVRMYPGKSVYHLRACFLSREPEKRIVEPYRAVASAGQGGERVSAYSWDWISAQRHLHVPADVEEVMRQLTVAFGGQPVPAQELAGLSVGEAQERCLKRLMGDQGLKGLYELDRVGFTGAFYWGSSEEVRQAVDARMNAQRTKNIAPVMESFLEEALFTPQVSERVQERMRTVFRRYLRTRGVELALPDDKVEALLKVGVESQRRPKRGFRR